MTTELTKAAQKNGPEVELCEQMQRAQARVRLLKPDDFDAPELDLSDSHTALFALAEYWKGKHDKLKALTQRPAAQTEREAFALARAFALATTASEEFVRCNGLSTGEADEFILTGPDLTDEHATACVEHLKHVGECVAFDCDDGVIVRLGDFTLGSLS